MSSDAHTLVTQAAMYQMLLLSNPQLMQARIASGHKPPEGTALPPPPTMASLQQVFATIANIASNATTMHPNLLYPSGQQLPCVGSSHVLSASKYLSSHWKSPRV